MSTRMETDQPIPSVIARLMGFEELWQPVQKKARVLSEDYLRKVTSIGVREKCSKHNFFRPRVEEMKEYEDIFQVLDMLKGNRHTHGTCEKSKVRSRLAEKASERQSSMETERNLMDKSYTMTVGRLDLRQSSLREKRIETIFSFVGDDKAHCLDDRKHSKSISRKGSVSNQQRGKRTSSTDLELARPRSRFSKGRNLIVGHGKNSIQLKSGNNHLTEADYAVHSENKQAEKSRRLSKNLLDDESVESLLSVNISADTVPEQSPEIAKSSLSNYEEQLLKKSLLSVNNENDSSLPLDTSVLQDKSSQTFEEEGCSSYSFGTESECLMPCGELHLTSPISVLEPFYDIENSSSSENLPVDGASLYGFLMRCETLGPAISESNTEESAVVSSDEDIERSTTQFVANKEVLRSFGIEESRDFSYLVDVLTEAGFNNGDLRSFFHNWHSSEFPINLSVFESLEKKYGEQMNWKTSERRILFDRVNLGLSEILNPFTGTPNARAPVAKRLRVAQGRQDMEEELWMLLVNREKELINEPDKALGKDDGWMNICDDISVIGREIENSLIDELLEEVTVDAF